MQQKLKVLIANLICLIMVFSHCLMLVMASDTVSYLSDLVVIYAENLKDAKSQLNDLNKNIDSDDSKWKLVEKNLNEGVDIVNVASEVYLAYKTSDKLSEAIRDIAVMDMNGNYHLGNFENDFKDKREKTKELSECYKKISEEFVRMYEEDTIGTKLAYRQLNLYWEDDTDIGVGDYFLNLPEDAVFFTFLEQSNEYILSDITSTLLAGIVDTEDNYLKRVEEIVQNETYKDDSLYEDAVLLDEYLKDISYLIGKYEALKDEATFKNEEINANAFATELAKISCVAEAFETVEYIDGYNLKDFFVENDWVYEDLYPLVAAMTEIEKEFMKLGLYYDMLILGLSNFSVEEFLQKLEETEEKLETSISVYSGKDRDIYNCTYAFTKDATRNLSDKGQTWDCIMDVNEEAYSYIGWNMNEYRKLLICAELNDEVYYIVQDIISEFSGVELQLLIRELYYQQNYDETEQSILFTILGDIDFGEWISQALNVFFLYDSIMDTISFINSIHDYYFRDFLEIPEVIVDYTNEEYVKYVSVKDLEGNSSDINGWYGKQWNALYYTKDPKAGSPLIGTYSCQYGDSFVRDDFKAVHLFGQSGAFDLNSHQYNNDVDGVYLSFRTNLENDENAQFVGSFIGEERSALTYYLLIGCTGVILGMGIIGMMKKK